MIKITKKFFYEFDIFNASANLRMNEDPQMKSCPIGFVSFLFIIFFMYWFISICADLFSYNRITSSSQQTAIKHQAHRTQWYIRDFRCNSRLDDLFKFQTIINVNNTEINVPMKKCQPEQWKLLGDNYLSIYEELNIGKMICPDRTLKFSLQGTGFPANIVSVYVDIRFCNNNRPSCNISNGLAWLHDRTQHFIVSSQLKIIVLDKVLYPSRKDPIAYLINYQTTLQITDIMSGFALIQFSYFKIQTDYSFLPNVAKQYEEGIIIDKVKKGMMTMVSNYSGLIARVYFVMNSKVQTITRSVGKLDNVLSYTGGLFSILMAFLGFFLFSFNQYKHIPFDQPYIKQQKNQIKRLDFWMYIKYTVFDWINLLFCCSLKWEQCEAIDKVLEQIQSQMELQRIFRRLQNIDRGLDQVLGEDRRVCLSLMKLPSREQSKLKRLINDYYDEISNEEQQIKQQNLKNIDENTIHPQQVKHPSQTILNISNQLQCEQTLEKSDSNSKRTFGIEPGQLFTEQMQIISKWPLSQDMQQAENKIIEAFRKLKPQQKQQFQLMMPAVIYYRIKSKIND